MRERERNPLPIPQTCSMITACMALSFLLTSISCLVVTSWSPPPPLLLSTDWRERLHELKATHPAREQAWLHLRQKAAQITEGSVFCTASISPPSVSSLEPFPPLHLPHQKGLENENFRLFHTPTEPHTDFQEPHLNEIELAFLLNSFRKNTFIKSKRT